jgi:methionyl-tRNA formyltransferase
MGFSAVKELLLQRASHLPIYQPEKASIPEFAEILKNYRADLFVVVAYGEIIKQNLLDLPKRGSLNIHASLLPKYRGAAPIQRCLMSGERETGISIIEMVLQMDAGDVLAMDKIPISEEMTFGELEWKLSELASALILRVIEEVHSNRVTRSPQNHSEATFAPKIAADDQKIKWERSAREIHNQVRALSPSPGAWTSVEMGEEQKKLKIKRSKVVEGESVTPGRVLAFGKKGWIVACGQQALSLLEVQLEGKREMKAEEFIKGCRQPPLDLV